MLQRIENSELKESEEVTSELRSAKKTKKKKTRIPPWEYLGKRVSFRKLEVRASSMYSKTERRSMYTATLIYENNTVINISCSNQDSVLTVNFMAITKWN